MDLQARIDALLAQLLEQWHRPRALAVALSLAVLGGVYLASTIDLKAVSATEIIVLIFALLIITLIWYESRRLPRTRKGRVGFVIGISAEDVEYRRSLQRDFVSELRRALDIAPHQFQYDFIELPEWISAGIVDAESARAILRKCRAHFLVFGTARVRETGGKQFHVLRLREIVVHKHIPISISKKFAQEMSDVFPADVRIDRENDLLGLDIASTWLAEASVYFIAVAALMSGDLRLSEVLLETLHQSQGLANLKAVPGVKRLRGLIPRRLSDVYLIQSTRVFEAWREGRNQNDLARARALMEQAESLHLESRDQYHLLRAISFFVCDGNVVVALREARACKGSTNPIWRYSVAFLEAFQGNYQRAIREYKQAFRKDLEMSLLFQVEEFLSWQIQINPDFPQLYFCRGLVNMNAIGDGLAACEDFRKFLELTSDAELSEERKLVSGYVDKLEAGQGAADEGES